MTYSCGIFDRRACSLEQAQENKHALISKKLELGASSTVVDVGCGWGSFLTHAAAIHGSKGIGITLSLEQARAARAMIAAYGLSASVSIRYADYREPLPVVATTAVSVGMFEHVGKRNAVKFFRNVRARVVPRGLYLNQSIVRARGRRTRFRHRGFAQRYIFPNGELLPLSFQLRCLEAAGMDVVHIETFGDHYAQTLAHWYSNLVADWPKAISLIGAQRARAWKLYLLGSQRRFESGDLDLAQVLCQVSP